MDTHYINVEDKFMTGIMNGAISALIFNTVPVTKEIKIKDIVVLRSENYDNVKKVCKGNKLLSSRELNDVIAKQCGFQTLELLLDDLYHRFGHKHQDNHIYYILYLQNIDPKKLIINGIQWNTWTYSVNTSFYNPEYDEKPWRD